MRSLFVDVDTQNDFMLPSGALYAPGADHIIPAISKLNHAAVSLGHKLVSTTCFHSENDSEFSEWPPHCIAGTVGQLKPSSTLVGQLLFEKQSTDVFRSPHWIPYLREHDAREYIVYGVVTEVCVRFAAQGLLQLGKPVTIVLDAVQALNSAAETQFLDSFRSAGGLITGSADLQARLT